LVADNRQLDAQIFHGIGAAKAIRATIVVHSSEFEPGVLLLQVVSRHNCDAGRYEKKDRI